MTDIASKTPQEIVKELKEKIDESTGFYLIELEIDNTAKIALELALSVCDIQDPNAEENWKSETPNPTYTKLSEALELINNQINK